MSKILMLIGVVAMLAFSIVLFITFTAAYLSPSKTVVISINNYGEADVEMILLSLLLPLGIVSSVIFTQKFEQDERESIIMDSIKNFETIENNDYALYGTKKRNIYKL